MRQIIVPFLEVTHFTMNFLQYLNFCTTLHNISLRILTVGKDKHMLQNMHTHTFTKYSFCDLRHDF